MKPFKQKVPESGVLRACLDLLAYERIWHRRWNSGAMRDHTGRPVRFGNPGDADILASVFAPLRKLPELKAPAFLWIECKSDSGCQSHEQFRFQQEVEAQSHFYILVRSSDDLKSWLKLHGVIK